MATWPIERPPDWVERVNRTDDERELESLRQSVHRRCPFGRQEWQEPIARRLGLESAYRPSGRQPKMGHLESGP
jgi:putative transposase